MAEELEEYGDQGKVVAVFVVPTGDELELDAVTGQTVLQLSDVADFSETGGQVQINETTYPYMGIDDDLNTLTLATGLVEDVPMDTKVFLYPLSNEKWAMVQVVDIEEPVDARIPHQLTDLFDEGVRDLGDQESVSIVLEGGDWVVRDVIGKEPSIDGGYIRPETLPSPDQTDGLPPVSAPVVMLRPLGWSGMTITWSPVPNTDPVTYKVLFDSVNPPVQELTDTMGTITSTSVLKDGTQLNPDTVYYAQVIPYDDDGPGPASAVVGGSPVKVPVDAVVEDIMVVNNLFTRQGYFGAVSADQIETAEFTATLAVIAGGLALGGDMDTAGITMTPERIEVVHNDGTGSEPRRTSTIAAGGISLRAEATLLSAVIDKMVVRGVDSEIATGAEVTVQAGTTSPKQAPTISYEYPQHWIHEGFNGRGLVKFPAWDANRWLMTESLSDCVVTSLIRLATNDFVTWPNNVKDDFVYGFDAWGLKGQGGRSEVSSGQGGVTVLGDQVYVLCETTEAFPGTYRGRWYVYQLKFNGVAPVTQSESFSGTALPSGWAANQHQSGIPSATGPAVVSTGVPTGSDNGSALKFDFGDAGIDGGDQASSGTVTPNFPVMQDSEIRLRFRPTVVGSPFLPAESMKLYVRAEQDANNVVTKGIALDLVNGFNLWDYTGSSNNSLGNVPAPSGYAANKWYWAKLKVAGNVVTAAVWEDGTTEPAGTVVNTTILTPGKTAIKWGVTDFVSGPTLGIDVFVDSIGLNVFDRYTFVRRWLYEPKVSGVAYEGAASVWKPAIGNNGTNILIVQANKNEHWVVNEYGPTGTHLSRSPLYQSDGTTYFQTGRHAGGIVHGAFDGYGDRWYVATESYPHVYSFYPISGVRQDTLTPFAVPETPMRGLAWDGIRFIHRGTTKAFYYSRIMDVTGVKGVQTWRKHDATDAITPTVGDKAEFETSPSPEASPVLRTRAYIRIQSPSDIPSSGGADSLSFYLKRTSDSPAGFRIVPPPNPGVQSVLLDTWPTTQITPPAATTFGSSTPAKIKSAGQLPAGGPVWQLTGNGPGNIGDFLSWDADGKTSGWVDFNAGAGDAPFAHSTYQLCRYRKFGPVVQLQIHKVTNALRDMSTNASGDFANVEIVNSAAIPVEIRPPGIAQVMGGARIGDSPATVALLFDGRIIWTGGYPRSYASGVVAHLTFTYLV